MRTKVTLILLLLNVALLAVILYARREWRVEQDLARISNRVLGEEAIGMRTLEITVPGNDRKILLERSAENAAWDIKVPINWPANDFAVRRIVHELEFLESETRFSVDSLKANNQSLADYGLDPARLTLTFTRPALKAGGPDITTRLQIGDVTTKLGNRLYVLSPDGETVHVVRRSLAESLIVGMDELRTDALFTIPVFEVRSLGLQNAAPAPRVRLRRDGARWAFEAPIVTRAAKAPSELVISGLNNLRALTFLADVPTTESGLDKPSLRVTIEGNSRRETILLGNPYPAGSSAKPNPAITATFYHAQMEGRSQVFVTSIPNALLETLRRAQDKLRDPLVLDFDPADVTSISLAAPGQVEPLVLRLDDSAGWRIVRSAGAPELPADAKLVGNLLHRLALLTVVPDNGFLRDAPSDAEIENYGFNLPQREITLTLKPTASGQTPPAPHRITLQIGLSNANGGTVQARVLGQSFIYAVANDTLNDLPVAPNVYRARTLRTLPEGAKPTRVTLTENAAPDKPLVNLTVTENQTFEDALATEPEVRREALASLVRNVATLRAKNFVSDTFTETTLVDGNPTPWKYTLTVAFNAGGAETVTTLKLAERSGGGTQLAGSEEFNNVFAIDQPLLDALWSLIYGDRDPGAPAVSAAEDAQPAAAP